MASGGAGVAVRELVHQLLGLPLAVVGEAGAGHVGVENPVRVGLGLCVADERHGDAARLRCSAAGSGDDRGGEHDQDFGGLPASAVAHINSLPCLPRRCEGFGSG